MIMDETLRQQVSELENATRNDAEQIYTLVEKGGIRLNVEPLVAGLLSYCQLVAGNAGLNALWGLGVNEAVTKDAIDALVMRLNELAITCSLQLAPIPGGDQVRRMLLERGFMPAGKFAMLRYADPRVWRLPDEISAISIRKLQAGETALFSRLNAEGYGRSGPEAEVSRSVIGQMSRASGVDAYIAWIGDESIAQAMMIRRQGTAGLYNAATISQWRRRGAHIELTRRRLADAIRDGAELLYSRVPLGSGAQRNLERNGFAVAYTSEQLVRPIGKQIERGGKDNRRKQRARTD